MENIIIDGSKHTPRVEFQSNGNLKLEGRSIISNAGDFYNPLIDFILKLEVEKVVFDVKLEYINSASSKKLMELFKLLDLNYKIQKTIINWHNEVDDEDIAEMAQFYKDILVRSEFCQFEVDESV